MHMTELFVPEPSFFEVEVATKKLKRYKSGSRDQIPAQLNHAGGNTLGSEIHKESIRKPSYKKGDKTECSNYRGISVLPTTYKILFNIPISGLTQYVDKIIEDH
jgi:hypothetical protein